MAILLSLVMIVRNEELHLAKCLESLHQEVDEIIIVDTGSTDRTREIALNYTTKLYTFPWNNDFSAARNFALKQARGQWVLALDADETLESQPGELRSLISTDPRIDAYLLQLYNPTSENTEEYNCFQVLRLFRNNGVLRYSGSIHEQVNITAEGTVALAPSPIIRHQALSRRERLQKRGRNLSALQKSLRNDPDNPFLHYYLGVEWMMLNKPEHALPYLQRAYLVLPQDLLIFRTSTLRYLTIALHTSGETLKALELILEGNANYPGYADLLYLGGVFFREIAEYALSIKWLKEAIISGTPPALYSHLTGSESFSAYYQLGICYEKLGDQAQAQDAYLSSLQNNPSYIYPLYPLLNLLITQRSSRQALVFLTEHRLLLQPQAALAAAQIFFMLGYPNLSLASLNQSSLVLKAELIRTSGIKGEALDTHNSQPTADSQNPVELLSVQSAFAKYELFSGQILSALERLKSLKSSCPFETFESLDAIKTPGLSVKSRNELSHEPELNSFCLENQRHLILAYLLLDDLASAWTLARKLWRIPETRREGYAFIALITLLKKGRLHSLPTSIRESNLSEFLISLYQELLNYLPSSPSVSEPAVPSRFTSILYGLETLIKTTSPNGLKQLQEQIDRKSRDVRSVYQLKFGTGWEL